MAQVTEAVTSRYLAWNNALLSHFFRPDVAGQPVYLFVTEELINEVGRPLGAGVSDFIQAVRAGPRDAARSGHCQRALQLASGWRTRDLIGPPYIAYLALFVLADGHEGDFAPHAYYPRLWELLGEPTSGQPPSFDRMVELWDDLERWSVHDQRGALGVFEARVVGGWVHVGLPMAQTILTEAERRALPRIFADAGLEPGTPPSNRELQRALTVFGRSWLRPRTLSPLNLGTGSFVEAVLDLVSDDFQDWNGEVPDGSGKVSSRRQLNAGLRLCLTVDRVAGRVRAQLRCRSWTEFPDRDLSVTSAGNLSNLTCSEYAAGWSTALFDADAGAQFEPPRAAWTAGLSMTDEAAGWRLRLRPAKIRAFVSGSDEALPGLVEVHDLPRGRPFYLAFPLAAWPSLQTWLQDECDGWRQLDISTGLPSGWALGEVAAASSDRGCRAVDPNLGFPDRLSIRFVGGVRAAPGNSYLAVAPPTLVLDGATTGDVVYCDGEPLGTETPSASTYLLPANAPTDRRISIEVRRGETVVRRSSVYLLSGFSWRLEDPIVSIDRFGRHAVEGPGVAGAGVPWEPAESFAPDLLRTPGLSPRATRVYFVGRTPAEIACWPRDPLPEWAPVWAIPIGARARGQTPHDLVCQAAAC
jgi:hypothetical protein